MALSDLAVFSEHTYTSMTEVLRQQIDLFNAASNGGIVLRSAAREGDYSDEVFWALIANLVRRRNAYGTGTVAATTLEHLVATTVKVAAGTPPVTMPPSQFTWIQRNPEEGGIVYGEQLAVAALADMLNTAISAFVAGTLNAGAEVYTDQSANPTTLVSLNNGARLFGDRAQEIACWLMHSTSVFDIYGAALTNTAGLFSFGTVNVRQDGFGRAFVVTDSPSLVEAGGDHYIGGLVPGAVLVEQNNDFDQNVETNNGFENIQRSIQSEWTYNLGVKGYAWDKTNGGHSPNNAAIATGTNWDRVATQHKDLAGVLIQVQ